MKNNDWLYEWYAVNKETNKIVYGFDDKAECMNYCKKHKFNQTSYKSLVIKTKLTPNIIDNWSDEWPEPEI